LNLVNQILLIFDLIVSDFGS